MGVKIDKHIPIPPRGQREPKYPWHRMSVGDSILLTVSNGGARSMANKAGKKFKMRFAQSRVEGGIRVWRIA